jgi:uncharacterized membrane protein YeaQ/YmgE (transglycosylase-associated protein family)
MSIIWLIGFVAGIIARLLSGPNNPSGFILTTIIGVVGAFLATFIGRPSTGTAPIRVRDSLARRSAP